MNRSRCTGKWNRAARESSSTESQLMKVSRASGLTDKEAAQTCIVGLPFGSVAGPRCAAQSVGGKGHEMGWRTRPWAVELVRAGIAESTIVGPKLFVCGQPAAPVASRGH